MLGSAHGADDAAQDTMLRARRSLDQLRDPDGLRPTSSSAPAAISTPAPDCVYPVRLRDPVVAKALVDELEAPVNAKLANGSPFASSRPPV